MKRALWLAAILVVLDQLTKTLAMVYLPGQRYEIAGGLLGLTYSINPGIWLDNSLDPKIIVLIQVLFVIVMVLLAGYLAIYRHYYRASVWIDLGFAFFLASALGNLYLDRFFFGFVRDFIVMPNWIANLADVYSNLFIACMAMEFVTYPPSRRLLRWTPMHEWGREFKFFYRFLRRAALQRLA